MIWAAFAGLVIAVLAVLMWPLLRRPHAVPDRAAYDLTIFEDQLKEVERDVARGVITSEEADAARIEIQRRILTAKKTEAQPSKAASSGLRAVLAAGLDLIVPVLTFAVYLPIGKPELPGGGAAERAAMAEDETNQIFRRLAKHLVANPEDVQGWRLLARSYRELRR
ncbi:MAG: c-type cytochrome biogenesis protein CcmI, partial [Rhodospirillaceae bacterium]